MNKKVKYPNKDWSELLGENKELYHRSRPKRAIFILDYLKAYCSSLNIKSFHEQGAFSGKDIRHIKDSVSGITCYASDLDFEIAAYLGDQGINAFACDAFSLPFKNDSFDLTFHSGLIVCFSNEDALSIVREQVRTTKIIAFVFAHNEFSWVDKLASLYKRKIQKKEIFNYRRFKEGELLKMASDMGLNAEIHYFDNAFMNFLKRNFVRSYGFFSSFDWIDNKVFFNEIVMVIRK